MEYWKFKAIDKLRDYCAQKASLENIPDEIRRLESEARSIKSATADGSPVRGGENRREERLLSNIVKREELKVMLARAKLAVRITERGLAVLNDQERHLLDCMYITEEKQAVARLMEEYSWAEESSVYRHTNKALLRFTIAMYGATES